MGAVLLLTGRPGVGKTTLIRRVAEALGDRAGGFFTEEIRGPQGRLGFRLVTLDGRAAIFAHVDWIDRTPHRVGRYGVDITVLDDLGVAAIREAVDHREVVLVDEIGKMELFSAAFREALEAVAASPRPMIATITRSPHPWADAFKRRPGLELWELTPANREALLGRVLRWIQATLPRSRG
ncbi:NTPase [Thermoflexus sp.]|uniref:NTPase n=1 Tax=Thermoflexus sp. TaxID=1969742 RepID=UPI0025F9A5AE|nr:NTPase [Thermoflexus sp.]MDW8180971.1 NTPase [Anaerolineae bacterium]MCS6963258.1 NTPase [Thermoflexus sp.]MCS7351513.1 NTPase [Thermoflexus sp.]MCX7690627.1 NTPase [Thermoflexus sp.]MDW8183997.1 NTPase [Anaerolineae bacterium]